MRRIQIELMPGSVPAVTVGRCMADGDPAQLPVAAIQGVLG
jgi:hypothetical protein